MRPRETVFIFAALLVFLSVRGPAAQTQSKGQSAAARQYFTDVPLVDQNGQDVRFYSDLLKGKVVVIETFFGTCTGSCPRMAGILEGLQTKLGDQLGRDVFFLSFTVDPENDTPAKLKMYADEFHAKPGWLFLTGKKENVDFALSYRVVGLPDLNTQEWPSRITFQESLGREALNFPSASAALPLL